MKPKKPRKPKTPEQEADFVMENGDRFHAIIASDPIYHEQRPNVQAMMVVLVIRKASGVYEILTLAKLSDSKDCVRPNAVRWRCRSRKTIDSLLKSTRTSLSAQIRKKTGLRVKWNAIDLSDVRDRKEQIRRIQAWGGLGAGFTLNGECEA